MKKEKWWACTVHVLTCEEINHVHALIVEHFASIITLEVLWQALFNSATHVHKGTVVSL